MRDDDDDLVGKSPWPPAVPERLGDYVRELRRIADLSQRELSSRSLVALATIVRLESDAPVDPRLSTIGRLAESVGLRLLLCDDRNEPLPPQSDVFDICRDLAGRRLPPHLDVEKSPDERYRLWWQPKRGPFTFVRDRGHRDEIRVRNRVWIQRYLAERDSDLQD